jgi:AcrR family transcriptional regulator
MPDSTREKILSATVTIIGREGPQRVTVRRIAKEAGVNMALVNYHFRTKDKLVAEAIQSFFGRMREIFERLEKEDKTPEERLHDFFAGFLHYFMEFPGVFITQVLEMVEFVVLTPADVPRMTEKEAMPLLFGLMSDGSAIFRRILSEFTGIKDEQTLAMRVIQLMSNIAHPLLLTEMPKILFGLDFHDPAQRERYVSMVIRSARNFD